MKQQVLDLINAAEMTLQTDIQGSDASLFTKQDVATLLSQFAANLIERTSELQQGSTGDIKLFAERIKEHLMEDAANWEWDNDCVALESAEFSLSGNEINLDSCEVDERVMRREVKSHIECSIDEYLESITAELEGDMNFPA